MPPSKGAVALAALLAGLLLAPGVRAQETALRTALFASDDADDTSVVKASAGVLLKYAGPDSYHGLVAENLRIRPLGGERFNDERLYYAFARQGDTSLKGMVGTDGHTLLGTVSAVREGSVRQEYFVERDRLETRLGVQGEGLFHTFAGAAFDVQLDQGGRQQLTFLGGVQDFSGDNLRVHLRARYIAVVAPESGVSLQLRTRAFRNTHPFEADYYSPEWFVEAMPTVQVRRFHRRWMFSAAAGWGAQRGSVGDWWEARLMEVSVNSPVVAGKGFVRLGGLYSNTPVGSGASYGYRQLTIEWVRPL